MATLQCPPAATAPGHSLHRGLHRAPAYQPRMRPVPQNSRGQHTNGQSALNLISSCSQCSAFKSCPSSAHACRGWPSRSAHHARAATLKHLLSAQVGAFRLGICHPAGRRGRAQLGIRPPGGQPIRHSPCGGSGGHVGRQVHVVAQLLLGRSAGCESWPPPALWLLRGG